MDLPLGRTPEQPLGPVIVLVHLAVFFCPPGRPQVVHALGINRKEAHCGAILRRHVRDRRPVHNRQRRSARAEELYKFPHHLCLAQDLRDGQREIRRCDAFLKFARQMHSNYIRRQEINRLSQHSCFRLDSTNPPSNDPQTIDHGRVRISANQSVRVINQVLV